MVLPGPEAAARAAAAAPAKKRNEAEAAIAEAVSKALHMLGSLKQIVPLVAGWPSTLAPAPCGECCYQSSSDGSSDELCPLL